MTGHDYCHCTGKGCPIKELCFRYALHLEEVDFPTSYFINPPYDDGKCEEYIENKQTE